MRNFLLAVARVIDITVRLIIFVHGSTTHAYNILYAIYDNTLMLSLCIRITMEAIAVNARAIIIPRVRRRSIVIRLASLSETIFFLVLCAINPRTIIVVSWIIIIITVRPYSREVFTLYYCFHLHVTPIVRRPQQFNI